MQAYTHALINTIIYAQTYRYTHRYNKITNTKKKLYIKINYY